MLGRMPKILASFKAKHPKVSYDLLSTTTTGAFEVIQNGSMELGIVRAYQKFGDCEYMDLEEQNWYILMPKDHPLAQLEKDTVSMEELADYDLALPKNSTASQTIRGLFQLNGISANFSTEYEPWSFGYQLASAGVALAFVPMAEDTPFHNSHIVAKAIEFFDFSSTISVVYNRYSGLSRLAKAFLNEILESSPNCMAKD